MTCFNKLAYKILKKAAKLEGDIHVGTWEGTYKSANGVSVAFRPAIVNSNCRMLDVAVSYCSTEDKYKRKHGKYQALEKLSKNITVQLPLYEYYIENGAEDTTVFLLEIFSL